MVKRHHKGKDGKYHIGSHNYENLEGSRAQVWHGNAYKTPGGLKRDELKMHRGRIISKKKSELAKSQKHLSGHLQPKGSGKFGTVKKAKKGKKGGKKHGTRKNHSKKSRK
tara:strand:- start:65 stop:394 length:330 start_codon:yes stop_codon:yes gene_type:complete